MPTSPLRLRVALPFLFAVTGCTVGAPAPGGPTSEPDVIPSGAASGHAAEAAPAPAPAQPPTERARWTVFVYANGDSGRSQDLADDLARISAAKLSPDVRVIVLADWNAALADANGDSFPSGSDWFSVQGSGARITIAHDAEQDFDDPAVLRGAVGRAFRDHPAEHHGLVIWSRGGGGDVQDGRRSGAPAMTPPSMTSAIRDGLADAGLYGDRALDFIGFDTFGPARVEVAYGMRELAQVQVLNAASSSGSTWAYADALSFLADHGDASASSFAAFEAQAASKQGPRAHAAIATAELDGLATATSSLVQAVIAHPTALPGVLSALHATAAHAEKTGRPPSYPRFITELASRPDLGVVATAAETVAAQLERVFVGATDETSDLAITLPTDWPGSTAAAHDVEAAKDWWRATGWDDLPGAGAEDLP